MTRIFSVILLLVLLSGGVGSYAVDKLNIKSRLFCAPLGFAILLALLQLSYYPAQLFNLSFTWIISSTSLILIGALIVTIRVWKQVFKQLFSRHTIMVVLCAGLFLFAFGKCYIDLDFSDSATYINYIVQNINIEHLNLFVPTSGEVGAEWDVLYLFQGFFHFGSFLCWFVNLPYYLLGSTTEIPNLVIVVWGMGLLYNILSTMLIIDIVHNLHIPNLWFRISLLLFFLFFTNFYYWKVAFAFYGNTFRGFFVTLLLYMIYRWLQENNDSIKYVIPFVVGAGLSCSSSFLFMSFEILYCLAAFLFYERKNKSLNDLFLMITPLVLYAGAFISRNHLAVTISIYIIYGLFLAFHRANIVQLALNELQRVFENYVLAIFYIGIPLLFVVGSAYFNLFTKLENTFSYGHYFWNFRSVDMVKDYLFVYSGWIDNLLNLFRWTGVILLLLKAKTEEDQFLKHLMILMMVFFLSPLCMTLIEKTFAGIVFYRAFEVMFNPFTECILFSLCWQMLSKKRNLQWGLDVLLVGVTVTAQILSYRDSDDGLYSFYINGGQRVDSTTKQDPDEAYANRFLQEYVQTHPQDGQLTIISQSNATRSYLPQAYQLFTARDYFYWMFRLDENFYQIASRHYEWLEPVETDYSVTCENLKKYSVDYILLEYWENTDFDQASDACSVTLLTGAKYKVKLVTE